MCRSRWLQFTVEQIPYLWPTQGIVTPVSDTSEFALDWFGDDTTHQSAGFRTRGRVRTFGHVMLASNWIHLIKHIAAMECVDDHQ